MGCGDVRLLRTIGGLDVTGQERAALNKLTMPSLAIALPLGADGFRQRRRSKERHQLRGHDGCKGVNGLMLFRAMSKLESQHTHASARRHQRDDHSPRQAFAAVEHGRFRGPKRRSSRVLGVRGDCGKPREHRLRVSVREPGSQHARARVPRPHDQADCTENSGRVFEDQRDLAHIQDSTEPGAQLCRR